MLQLQISSEWVFYKRDEWFAAYSLFATSLQLYGNPLWPLERALVDVGHNFATLVFYNKSTIGYEACAATFHRSNHVIYALLH